MRYIHNFVVIVVSEYIKIVRGNCINVILTLIAIGVCLVLHGCILCTEHIILIEVLLA